MLRWLLHSVKLLYIDLVYCSYFAFYLCTVLLLLSSYILLQTIYHLHQLKIKRVTHTGKKHTQNATLGSLKLFRLQQDILTFMLTFKKAYRFLSGESLEKWAPLANEEKVFYRSF